MESTAQVITEFSQEVIWDSKKMLFNTYFKDSIFADKYKYVLIEMDNNMTFEQGLDYLYKKELG